MLIGIDASRAFVNERTGTEEYSYQLIKEMVRLLSSKNDELVLFVRPGARLPSWSKKKRVYIREIKLPYLWTQLGLAASSWGRYGKRKRRLDVLWVPAHTLPVLRWPGLKTVVTIHGLEYQWLPEYRNLLQRWYLPLSTYYAARQADKLIAVSQNTKNELVAETGIEGAKVEVVMEGVVSRIEQQASRATRESVLRQYQLEKGSYILFVGSLQPRKNLSSLIEAFALSKVCRKGWKLVIVGGKGWMSEEIFASPGKNGVQERVVFTGRVSEEAKWSLIEQAGIYVQPSLTEGFGLPVLEAMKMGVPVISSDGGALSEVVGKSGVVVRLGVGFEKRLAKQLDQLANNHKLQKSLSEAGKKRVGELSWKRAATGTLSVIKSL